MAINMDQVYSILTVTLQTQFKITSVKTLFTAINITPFNCKFRISKYNLVKIPTTKKPYQYRPTREVACNILLYS